MSYFDTECDHAAAQTQSQISACRSTPSTSVHFVADNSTHVLAPTATEKHTFNDEEEDIVICNGWDPEKENYKMTTNL